MSQRKPPINNPKEANTFDFVDSLDPNVEDFVAPLIKSISNLKIEKIDLTSAESARAAIPGLDQALDSITQYQKQVKMLKTLLEEKRDKLIKEKKDLPH